MSAPSPAFAVFALHAAATLVMVGVIWLVQLVHYPLLARLDALDLAAERASHARHVRRTGWVVAPPMLLELLGALWLLVERPSAVPFGEAALGAALVAARWSVTALEQAPLHRRLMRRRDRAAAARLVRTNWVRTALWNARGALVTLWLLRLGGAG